MTDYTLQREVTVPRPINEVFNFFSQAGNLEKLTPPWLGFNIVTPGPIEMRKAAKISYKIRIRGIPVTWLTEIESWNPPYEFVDVQVRGPYKRWRHTHRFTEVEGGTRITDIVNYALPLGPLGRLIHYLQVRRDIATIFDFREQEVRKLFP